MRPRGRPRAPVEGAALGRAALGGLAVALAAYPAIRLWTHAVGHEPSPTLPFTDGPIALFVRTAVALYAGALASVPFHLVARRAPAKLDRALGRLWCGALLLLLAQVVFVP